MLATKAGGQQCPTKSYRLIKSYRISPQLLIDILTLSVYSTRSIIGYKFHDECTASSATDGPRQVQVSFPRNRARLLAARWATACPAVPAPACQLRAMFMHEHALASSEVR